MNSKTISYIVFIQWIFVLVDISCVLFQGLWGFDFAESNLNIFIFASHDMEVGQGKSLSYSFYIESVQINKCRMLRLSINWWD